MKHMKSILNDHKLKKGCKSTFTPSALLSSHIMRTKDYVSKSVIYKLKSELALFLQ